LKKETALRKYGISTGPTEDTRFVLLSTARSGTSAIISALRKHPLILGHGEIFHKDFKRQLNPQFVRAHRLEDIDVQADIFAYRILAYTDGEPVVGFKMWRGQNLKAYRKIAADEGIKKLVLERKNRLASYSSLKLAQMTNQWGKQGDIEAPAPILNEFDEDAFTEYAARIDQLFRHYASDCDGEVLFLEHRQIGEDALEKVLDFLNVEHDATDIFMRRQNTPKIIERFTVEVQSKVRRTLDKIGHSEWVQE